MIPKVCVICNKPFFSDRYDNEQEKCILHCDKSENNNWFKIKNNKKRWSETKINNFWNEIHNLLEKNYIYSEDNYSLISSIIKFDSIIFPKFQEDISFDIEDAMEPCYELSNFYFLQENPEFNDPEEHDENDDVCKDIENFLVYFENCIFLDEVDLRRYKFKNMISFNKCTFESKILLSTNNNALIIFENECNFSNIDLNLDFKTFNKQFNLIDCVNIKKVSCINTHFNIVSFKGSKFDNVNFYNTTFNEKVSFINTEFNKKCNFVQTSFEKICSFRNATFNNYIDFTDTVFKDNVNFLDIKVNKLKRETARIIKDSFEKQNNIIEANRFYALEMKERKNELKWNTPIEKLVFLFHGLSSNHSQNWLLALFWIFIVGMTASLVDFYFFSKSCYIDCIGWGYFPVIFIGVIFLYHMFSVFYDYKYFFGTFVLSIYIGIYLYLTQDCFFINFSKIINPFSIMRNTEDINVFQLFFKIIITYLIYQLIISIRQNTRRK